MFLLMYRTVPISEVLQDITSKYKTLVSDTTIKKVSIYKFTT